MTFDEQLGLRRLVYKHRSPRWLLVIEAVGIPVSFGVMLKFYVWHSHLPEGINVENGWPLVLLICAATWIVADFNRRDSKNSLLRDLVRTFGDPGVDEDAK